MLEQVNNLAVLVRPLRKTSSSVSPSNDESQLFAEGAVEQLHLGAQLGFYDQRRLRPLPFMKLIATCPSGSVRTCDGTLHATG